MSRIGKQLTEVPTGVTVEVKNGEITVKGPLGELNRKLSPLVEVKIVDNKISVDVKNKEDKQERSVWGTTAAHIKNMVKGVTQVFVKEMEINGVGYRVSLQGKDLKLEVGFSHPVIMKMPPTVTAQVEKNQIKLSSIDKELLGHIAASVRAVRPPEPYKGKGIKYLDEQIRRKAGKAVKASAG